MLDVVGKWLIRLGLVWGLCLGCPAGRAAEADVQVTTARMVHPVLVRNDHNPLLQIVVQVQADKEVRLKAVHFTLDRSDDVGDLASLALFATGDKDVFTPSAPFGTALGAARAVAFRGDLVLRRGKNVFWLSGKLKPSADLSHRVAADCTSIETTSGQAEVNDLTPDVRQRIGIALRKPNDDGVHTYRIPALATTPRGTLLCVYDMRRRKGRDLQEDIDIGLSRSTDGGITWEPVRVIMDMGKYGGLPEEQNGCSDPGIIVDRKTGEIFCFAVWMHGKPGKHQWTGDGSEPGYEIGKSAQFLMVRSRDDGRTWSKPENLTRKLKKEAWWLFAPSPQQGINLADGTLVMPAQGRDENGKEFSTVMTSRDHGATWAVGAPAYRGGSECQAVQLGDGSIMLNMRNERERFRAVFVTGDLGQTWKPHVTNRRSLIEPNCNASLLRVDAADKGERRRVLLFSNPHSQKGRTHQTIQVSFDDGGTWPASHRLLLDAGRGAGYSSLTRVDDRHVGIVYEGSQAHLVFEKIALADLLDPAAREAAEFKRRAVSPRGVEYLAKLRKGTPFGTNDFNLEALRAGMGTRRPPTVPGVKLMKAKAGDIPCEWVLAPGADPDLRLLYIHGGGFVSGTGGYYLPLAAHLSAAARCAVLLPDYRLAPEHRFPAGLEDCIAAHQWMTANGPAGPAPARATFVAGDSAGGCLTLATLLALRDRRLPLPLGGIPLSAVTDLTLASASLKTAADPIISAKTMPEFRRLYLGEADPRNPLASPVLGDYRDIPPLLIQVGEHEMLRDDSIRVAEEARADGASVKLEVWPGMFHVFQSHEPLLPEARESVRHIAEFMYSLVKAKTAWQYTPELLRPFWVGERVEAESVLFIKDAPTDAARAAVLFPVREVLAVRNSAGDVLYEGGKDYVWKPGSREIVLPPGSRILSRTPAQRRRAAKSQQYELTHRDGNGEIFFGGKLEYAQMQTCITYTHAPNLWKGPVPKYDVKALPRSIDKLVKKQPLSIVTLGDSISAGANASALYAAAPFQPAYPELVRTHLEARFQGGVAMKNLAVGGTDTSWGLTRIDKVVSARPDLVILAFGMNDAAGLSAKDYQANTKRMIARIRSRLPDCEFILVAPMLGNRDWVRLRHELFPQYRDALKELAGPGVAVADLTSVWSGFLERKKDWDLSGNGVNHPNDFGHRVYAQVIAALLAPGGD